MQRGQMVASRTEVVAARGVVAAGHVAEAAAGVRMIERGGNAVDPLVAAAFTGRVVEPAACGIGGHGHLAISSAERDEFLTIDHHVRAPPRARAIRPDRAAARPIVAADPWPYETAATFLHHVDFGLPLQAAVDAPRVHCQGDATHVDDRIAPEVQQARLVDLGHDVVAQATEPGSLPFGRVRAVRIDPETGLLHAASGPARYSAAAGV